MGVRRNQTTLTPVQWNAFINAINKLHGTGAAQPAYRNFVQIHVDAMSMIGMSWGVHTMPQMGVVGRNFLAWHRRYLWQFERRLQVEDSTLTIPYWDWISQPTIPAALDQTSLLQSWSVTRNWTPADMPTGAELQLVLARHTFPQFQRKLESGPHADVHNAVGGQDANGRPGTMANTNSPADPIFWLHHANIDRLWAQWETQHPTAKPHNLTEKLQPPPLFGVAVSTELDIATLGYSYA